MHVASDIWAVIDQACFLEFERKALLDSDLVWPWKINRKLVQTLKGRMFLKLDAYHVENSFTTKLLFESLSCLLSLNLQKLDLRTHLIKVA